MLKIEQGDVEKGVINANFKSFHGQKCSSQIERNTNHV
jgi:hypothetical protein